MGQHHLLYFNMALYGSKSPSLLHHGSQWVNIAFFTSSWLSIDVHCLLYFNMALYGSTSPSLLHHGSLWVNIAFSTSSWLSLWVYIAFFTLTYWFNVVFLASIWLIVLCYHVCVIPAKSLHNHDIVSVHFSHFYCMVTYMSLNVDECWLTFSTPKVVYLCCVSRKCLFWILVVALKFV